MSRDPQYWDRQSVLVALARIEASADLLSRNLSTLLGPVDRTPLQRTLVQISIDARNARAKLEGGS